MPLARPPDRESLMSRVPHLNRAACVVLVAVFVPGVAADQHEFPYEAIVRTEQVEVRAGPGQRYYVTGHIKQNDRITVRRHDPGGWFMIDPPPGSFSYVDASLVEKTGESTGKIVVRGDGPAGRALVRIGSQVSDDHSYYGRELTSGDEVQLLGDATLQTDRGPVRYYRIAPPPLEYRWVKGDFIVPARKLDSDDPFAQENLPQASNEPAAAESTWTPEPLEPLPPASRERNAATISQQSRSKLARTPEEEMADLDRRYIELINSPPEQWDLDGLTSDFRQLKARVNGALAAKIDQRLDALDSRRKIYVEFQEFLNLTRQTEERDAALRASLTQFTQEVPAIPADDTSLPLEILPIELPPATAPSETPGLALPALPGPGVPGPAVPVQNVPVQGPAPTLPTSGVPAVGAPVPEGPAPAMAPSSGSAVMPALNGAGVVQKIPARQPGGFLYALTDTNGRVLAILRPEARVDLESQVGQSIGVIGRRNFDPAFGVDVIVVRQVMPVQLVDR